MKTPPEGKNEVLKFKLVFSLNRLPESVHEGELAQKFQGFTVYKKEVHFDKENRIMMSSEQDHINSDSQNPLGAGAVSDQVPVKMSLDRCLEAASMSEVMKD